MPIISIIGRRNWRVRFVIGTIYVLLAIGAVSMIYPLMLMLSGSVKSDTDYLWVTPVPAYLWNDDILWMKYIETKYATVTAAEKDLHRPIGSWRKMTPPTPASEKAPIVDAFREFRAQNKWPSHWYTIGQMQYVGTLGAGSRRFRALAKEAYPDIADYSHALGVRYESWSQVGPPNTPYAAARFTFPDAVNYKILETLKERSAPPDRIVVNLDGVFWQEYLRPQWATVEEYNKAHGTDYKHYDEVLLATTPPTDKRARKDWEQYVRFDLNVAFIHVDPSATPAFRRFLATRYDNDIKQLNRNWNAGYESFEKIDLPRGIPGSLGRQTDFSAFIKDAAVCPLNALSIDGPRQGFERFVAKQRGVPLAQVAPLAMPIEQVDYKDFEHNKSGTRWELFTRNYIQVIDFLVLNGNGMRNTIIYCGLMILVTLTVNPLAAYGLSRYRPPSTYKVLLFCMCTMAFPPEVTMIPSFLLLKRFPLIGLAISAAVGIPLAIALARLLPKWPDWIKGVVAGAVGLGAGFYLLPRLFGGNAADISLLNTFWALVLPGAANGFGIFLLKGFFDSLPQELYEAAEIDGAGELTKFWTITMSLSKPILAVLALQAFTAAYSEFMMALVIIPDPKMWTIMVWLFQLQSQVHPTVVYASLVIAAIPTFLVFLFCQNIIMRGIVVPTEK